VALIWFVVGVVLLLIELRHLALYALFGAVGCFGAAGVALVAPSALPVQAAAAVILAGAGVIAVRPVVSRAVHRYRHDGQVARGVHGGLIGHEALALDEISGGHAPGHVRFTGERWLAVSGDGESIPAGTVVVVAAVEGTTLVVWPVDGRPGLGRAEGGST